MRRRRGTRRRRRGGGGRAMIVAVVWTHRRSCVAAGGGMMIARRRRTVPVIEQHRDIGVRRWGVYPRRSINRFVLRGDDCEDGDVAAAVVVARRGPPETI